MVVNTGGPIAARRPKFFGVNRGSHSDLGDAGIEVAECLFDHGTSSAGRRNHPVREDDAFLAGEPAQGEPGDSLRVAGGQLHRQREIDCQFQVDVKELGT